ncbi:hypothetical protein ACOJCM_11900 [Billgrantia sp. LNSP4103-1]|uniref:hypothetical protein n=1 Tax=Billgrantia sp. LNSP4103-1 TaxID=3410266 RepID=UPI00403F2969
MSDKDTARSGRTLPMPGPVTVMVSQDFTSVSIMLSPEPLRAATLMPGNVKLPDDYVSYFSRWVSLHTTDDSQG